MPKTNGRQALARLLNNHETGQIRSELERNRVQLDEDVARLEASERQLQSGKYERGPKAGQEHSKNRRSTLLHQRAPTSGLCGRAKGSHRPS